jgi:hypothetical protein
MKNIFKSALFIIAIIIAASVIGCAKSPETAANPGYVLENLTERGIGFSFEYPIGYEKGPPDPYAGETDDVVGEIYVYVSNDSIKQKRISIQLWNPMTELPDAKARLDSFAANTENAGKDPEVSERSPLKVAGIDGEKLVYSVTIEEVQYIPNRLTGWVAAFDYQGQIWLIVVTTNLEAPDEAEADFDHLITTLKFSD